MSEFIRMTYPIRAQMSGTALLEHEIDEAIKEGRLVPAQRAALLEWDTSPKEMNMATQIPKRLTLEANWEPANRECLKLDAKRRSVACRGEAKMLVLAERLANHTWTGDAKARIAQAQLRLRELQG
jgi:hypothetical protein